MALSPDSRALFDGFKRLLGVDSSQDPLELPRNTCVRAVNTTFRGNIPKPRPGLVFHSQTWADSITRDSYQLGRWQGAHVYESDSGKQFFIVGVSGRYYKVSIGSNETASILEVTPYINLSTAAPFNAPAIGAVVSVTFVDASTLSVGTRLWIQGYWYEVTAIVGNVVDLENLNDPSGALYAAGAPVRRFDVNPAKHYVNWMEQADRWLVIQNGQNQPLIFDGASMRRANSSAGEIPVGKQMAYGQGRLWIAGINGREFYASDLVGDPSGTPGQKYRDAVLKMEGNGLLVGGGSFAVPFRKGQISALRFLTDQDKSLGQGPLQVFTDAGVFTCNAPIDRTEWASVTYPIVTQSAMDFGAEGQRSTILVNSDMFYRSKDGIRSWIVSRREWREWAQTPISEEVNEILRADPVNLLEFGSSAVFDKRFIITCAPQVTAQGIVHRGLIALDLAPVSKMVQTAQARYDGLWTGLNIYQILTIRVRGKDRCFAFCRNYEGRLELYELTKDRHDDSDDTTGRVPIIWWFETGAFFRSEEQPTEEFSIKHLFGGEIFYQNFTDQVDFGIEFRPTGFACWIPWHSWTDCLDAQQCIIDFTFEGDCPPELETYQPQFRNSVGLPQPPDTCDPPTKRPYRQFTTMQVRIWGQGYAEITKARFGAHPMPQPTFPKPVCST